LQSSRGTLERSLATRPAKPSRPPGYAGRGAAARSSWFEAPLVVKRNYELGTNEVEIHHIVPWGMGIKRVLSACWGLEGNLHGGQPPVIEQGGTYQATLAAQACLAGFQRVCAATEDAVGVFFDAIMFDEDTDMWVARMMWLH
jgi:hypothetical protein